MFYLFIKYRLVLHVYYIHVLFIYLFIYIYIYIYIHIILLYFITLINNTYSITYK